MLCFDLGHGLHGLLSAERAKKVEISHGAGLFASRNPEPLTKVSTEVTDLAFAIGDCSISSGSAKL